MNDIKLIAMDEKFEKESFRESMPGMLQLSNDLLIILVAKIIVLTCDIINLNKH